MNHLPDLVGIVDDDEGFFHWQDIDAMPKGPTNVIAFKVVNTCIQQETRLVDNQPTKTEWLRIGFQIEPAANTPMGVCPHFDVYVDSSELPNYEVGSVFGLLRLNSEPKES